MTTCPHCGAAVFKKSAGGTKLKARTSILVLHERGDVEINCGACGKGVLLPLRVEGDSPELRKATEPRLVARKT